jgi:glutathione S-transferase
MPTLKLTVLSLRYSSWSMRPWLALTHAGADFETETVVLPRMGQADAPSLAERRGLGSVRGLFPVLRIDGTPIHESLAICEHIAESFPQAELWPADPIRRAEARAVSCEMLSGFNDLRREMSCHLFGRVPSFAPGAAARADIERVFELWGEKLARSGGPFLFGRFSVADAMFYPVLTRFRTYGVAIPGALATYERAMDSQPAVRALVELARTEPHIEIYDTHLRSLGGEPDAALNAR